MIDIKSSIDELREIFNGLELVPESVPSHCLNASEYDDCGNDMINRNGRCRCFFEYASKRRVDKFKESIPERYRHELIEEQKLIASKITSGAWLWGLTGVTKTTIVYNYLITQAASKNIYCTTISDLLWAWVAKYDHDNPIKRDRALEIIDKVKDCDIMFIDDIDKMGTMTIAREQEFFNVIGSFADKKKTLLVTSNISLNEFCKRMPMSSAPIEKRLMELCKQIKI